MKRLLLLMILLLSVSSVQAQRDCTANLTEDECDLLKGAWEKFLEGGDYSIEPSITIQTAHGLTDNRYFDTYGTGILSISSDGALNGFYYEGVLLADMTSVFDSTSRRRYNEFWEYAYLDGNVHLNAEESDWQWTATGFNDLPIETLVPNLFEGLSYENLVAIESSYEGEESLIFQYSYWDDYMQTPFTLWHEFMTGLDLTEATGTGFYIGGLAISPETGEIQEIYFAVFQYLDAEALGGQALELRANYNISFVSREGGMGGFDSPPAHAEFDADGAFDDIGETGFLGLLNAALAEHLTEIFPPIGE